MTCGLLAVFAYGCNAVLGYESEYTIGDASPEGSAGDSGGSGGFAGDSSPDDVTVETDGEASSCDGGEQPIGANGEACCTPNELACAGHAQKLVLICDPTSMTWKALQSCSGKQLCDTTPGFTQGSCQEPVALCIGQDPGGKVCDGDQLLVCGPDLVTAEVTDCLYACVSGSCVGECGDGNMQCAGLIPQTCGPTGDWHNGAPCAFICAAGECTGECGPGLKQCSGEMTQECDLAGSWQEGELCPGVCTMGECAESCIPDSKQCTGSMVQACNSSGSWENDTACPYVCMSGGCTGVCSPDSKQCNQRVPQRCDASGQWQSGSTCPYVCSGGNCQGVCLPGAATCAGLVPQECDGSGQWQSGAACAYVCKSGVCQGECSPGAQQCNGLVPQSCDGSGHWQDGSACEFVCTAGTCAGGCPPGTKQCSGQIPQTCNSSGQWEDGAACQHVCAGGSCTGVCAPGKKQCSGLVPQTCDSGGQWQSGDACQYVCADGTCTGVCAPESKQCSGNLLQTCQASGQWGVGTACGGGTPLCSGGLCVAAYGPSCNGLAATCGSSGDASCCASIAVPGGTFKRSYDGVNYLDGSNPATVGDFKADTYEATVGRFRKFVALYPGNKPVAGAGKNPNDPADPGWDEAWNGQMPGTQATLTSAVKCNSSYQTWTDSEGGNENRPMNCITWYEAHAFCIWDGGRLPTEAEWNYLAAGGSEQRVYPWSQPPTSTTRDCNYASYSGCPGDTLNVGSKSPMGDGRWGHADVAGNVFEWVLDWSASGYPNPCTNCSNLTSGTNRVLRGGSFDFISNALYASFRGNFSPTGRPRDAGVRCVRSP